MSSITIGGIVSGLDTTSIIDKLVAVEGNSQTLLKNQQTAQKSAVTAYTGLLSSVGNLAQQVGSLAKTSAWATTSATSSSSSVTATATGRTSSSLTFNVTGLAAAHTLISGSTASSTGATVASSGSLSLTNTATGKTTAIDVGNGTLAEVVSAINGAGAGVTATAVQTSPGVYRLQVGSSSTGSNSQFSLSGFDNSFTMNTLTEGANATIQVGSGQYAYSVESSTNTFSNVATGINFTVSKKEDNVTVSSSVDGSSVADQISSIVTNANNLLSSIATSTAWDATSKQGGPLLGSSTVRSLQTSILSIVAGAGAPGLSVTAQGQLSFDADAFKAAFVKDPTGTAAAYGQNSSFNPTGTISSTATVTNATSKTQAGDYDINVTSPAKAETWQLVQPGTGIVGRLLTLNQGGKSVSYTVTAQDADMAGAAASFNKKLAEAGINVSAAADTNGNLELTSTQVGSKSAFTATIDGGGTATRTQAGADIQGTIDGVEATGLGNILTLPVDADSNAAGISVQVDATQADITTVGGNLGVLSYKPGVAQQLESLFEQMSDSATGQLVQAQSTASGQVKTLQTQIDNWTTRLDAYRQSLTAKFSAMETALSTLKSQSTAMSQFFGSSSSSSKSSS